MRKMKSISGISGLAMLGAALLSGCAGMPAGGGSTPTPDFTPTHDSTPTPALPHQGGGRKKEAPPRNVNLSFYTGGRYAAVLRDQWVIEDRRLNGPVTVAPQCEQAERRAAVKAEWAAVRGAPDSAPLPSSDVDDE